MKFRESIRTMVKICVFSIIGAHAGKTPRAHKWIIDENTDPVEGKSRLPFTVEGTSRLPFVPMEIQEGYCAVPVYVALSEDGSVRAYFIDRYPEVESPLRSVVLSEGKISAINKKYVQKAMEDLDMVSPNILKEGKKNNIQQYLVEYIVKNGDLTYPEYQVLIIINNEKQCYFLSSGNTYEKWNFQKNDDDKCTFSQGKDVIKGRIILSNLQERDLKDSSLAARKEVYKKSMPDLIKYLMELTCGEKHRSLLQLAAYLIEPGSGLKIMVEISTNMPPVKYSYTQISQEMRSKPAIPNNDKHFDADNDKHFDADRYPNSDYDSEQDSQTSNDLSEDGSDSESNSPQQIAETIQDEPQDLSTSPSSSSSGIGSYVMVGEVSPTG